MSMTFRYTTYERGLCVVSPVESPNTTTTGYVVYLMLSCRKSNNCNPPIPMKGTTVASVNYVFTLIHIFCCSFGIPIPSIRLDIWISWWIHYNNIICQAWTDVVPRKCNSALQFTWQPICIKLWMTSSVGIMKPPSIAPDGSQVVSRSQYLTCESLIAAYLYLYMNICGS